MASSVCSTIRSSVPCRTSVLASAPALPLATPKEYSFGRRLSTGGRSDHWLLLYFTVQGCLSSAATIGPAAVRRRDDGPSSPARPVSVRRPARREPSTRADRSNQRLDHR